LKKGKPKEKNDLNGIIVCGHCGHNYQVTAHSSDTTKRVWYACYWKQTKGKKHCRKSESIKRTTILDAYKKVVEFVKGQPLIKKILNPTTETLAVEERIKNLMAQEKLFLQMKARGMASDEIDTEHRRVVYRIKEAERERKRLMENNIHNATAHNELVDFNNTIKEMGAEITYNESQFKKIVKRIVVYSREEIDIVLRNGMTAKVHIEEMFREDDIIGEIEYGISEEHNDN
ncbi:MAG: zinc ribbon domain-containing protein, partial [Candidatus Borkfalkiaceae bacterium]|nr:zinc ribbon domain-containing protein [Christensenellaceae bacterium]